MLRKIATVIVMFLTGPAMASDPADEVRRAETAFAKAFADRDATKFFSFVTDDATFLGGLSTQRGKKEVVARWSRFFEGPIAPFSWGPERVSVNAAGTLGLSTGPVFDPDGNHAGSFVSTWVKQTDGTWKIVFDGSGPSPANLVENALKTEEGFVSAADDVKLHYRKVGNGPLAIIAPLGFVLHDDLRQFADIATVITYDMRNRGRSQRVEDVSSLTIQNDVKDLEAVRKHFNIDRFVPVGYSYLGLAVALYALEHPDRVTRIVQLGPVPRKFGTEYPKHLTNGTQDMEVPPADMKKWEESRAAGMAEKSPREFCDAQAKVFQYLLAGKATNARRVKNHCELENEWPVNFDRHLKHHFASVQKFEISAEAFAKVTVPVLTIHGTKDRNAPYGAGREWAMTLPNARLVTVEGGAHQSWADDPVTVFSAIREFLRGEWPAEAEKVVKLDPRE